MRAFLSLVIFILSAMSVGAAPLSHDQLAELVMPPFSVGTAVNERGV